MLVKNVAAGLALWLVVGNCMCVLGLPDVAACTAEVEVTPRGVTSLDDGAAAVIAADIDGDGWLDLVYAAAMADKVGWYRWNNVTGAHEGQRIVTMAANGVQSVLAADFDGDGDLDLASASQLDDKIAWYENVDGTGTFGLQRVVSTAADGAQSVFAADIDGDSDVDLASASELDSKIAWYENTDGVGTFGLQLAVSTAGF